MSLPGVAMQISTPVMEKLVRTKLLKYKKYLSVGYRVDYNTSFQVTDLGALWCASIDTG